MERKKCSVSRLQQMQVTLPAATSGSSSRSCYDVGVVWPPAVSHMSTPVNRVTDSPGQASILWSLRLPTARRSAERCILFHESAQNCNDFKNYQFYWLYLANGKKYAKYAKIVGFSLKRLQHGYDFGRKYQMSTIRAYTSLTQVRYDLELSLYYRGRVLFVTTAQLLHHSDVTLSYINCIWMISCLQNISCHSLHSY